MSTWVLVGFALLRAVADDDDREADMFGNDDSAVVAPETLPADGTASPTNPSADTAVDTAAEPSSDPSADDARDNAMFGGDDAPSPRGLLYEAAPNLLDAQDNPLVVGGQAFLRLNSSFREGVAFGDGTVNGPSILDAFADARPSDRVRAYAQLRFNFDYTVLPGELNFLGIEQEPFSLQLAQVWAKFDLGRVAYVTAGRQRIRWGTGRFWNPTDFINQEIRNSVDFFDQRVGVDLVKVHFPFEALGWNLYLIGAIGGVDFVKDTGIAARAEFIVGPAELSLSSFVKNDAPLRFGADVSAGVWLFDLKAEGVLSRGLNRRIFEGDFDFDRGLVPTEVDTDGQWFFEGVVGVETQVKYTDTDTLIFGGEYFYNQAGYQSATIYPFLFLNGAYVPLYTGQHYAAAYVTAPSPFAWNDLTLIVSTLGNLSDLSFLTRVDVQYALLQYVTVNGFVAGHWGSVGEFKLGIDIPPVPGVPQLADGLTLANDFIDVGMALRVAF
jgi:hypothetical protein